MKNVLRDRPGFSLPEFLAYASISRAIRPYIRNPEDHSSLLRSTSCAK